MLNILRQAKERRARAQTLLLAVSDASRKPEYYEDGRLDDALEPRLELLMAHGALALIRLRADPAEQRFAQVFVDVLFRHIDAGLREAGVGDLSVPRRMKKIASQFYGRLGAYSEAIAAQDRAALTEAVRRNVFLGGESAFAAPLAAHLAATAAAQALRPTADLAAADAWTPALDGVAALAPT